MPGMENERTAARFFRSIGLVPVEEEDFTQKLEEHGGAPWIEDWTRALDEAERDPLAIVRFFHQDFARASLGFGLDFERLCRAAALLASLEGPGAGRVLDLGGGGGQLAYWMRRLWPGARITVADPMPVDLGRAWARRLGIASIEFVVTSLPRLEGLEEGVSDLVILSSVLDLTLRANGGPGFPLELSDDRARDAVTSGLLEVWRSVGRMLAPGGSLIVLEELTATRLELLDTSLSAAGLGLRRELSRLDPHREGPSLLVASAAEEAL